MAWRAIPKNPDWQFNDTPKRKKNNSLWENMDFVGGVRTDGENQIFVQVRRAGDPDDADDGEISATYWNAKAGVLGVQPPSYYANLPIIGLITYDVFVPVGADSLKTSDGNLFLVRS